MTKWIVVDLDGTLCDCSHRVHLAQAKQWDEFHKGIAEDKVREDVAFFLDEIAGDSGVSILLCTGRNEQYRKQTWEWLKNSNACWFDDLIMRPNNNHESDDVLKVRMVDEFFGGRAKALEQVAFVL